MPHGVTRALDFSSLTADNIERIEVLRGPQTLRYGAGAIGGVINIITKVGKLGRKIHYGLEEGSYNTKSGAADYGSDVARRFDTFSILLLAINLVVLTRIT